MVEYAHYDTHKLIRCDVLNAEQQASVRFIEIEAYKMWEYLMSTKHGLEIQNPTLCLWLSEREYLENSHIFQRSGEVEAVNRIIVEIFDAEYGFSHTIERYSLADESEKMVGILESHIPEGILHKDSCNIDIISGYIVQQWQHVPHRPVIMGLEG